MAHFFSLSCKEKGLVINVVCNIVKCVHLLENLFCSPDSLNHLVQTGTLKFLLCLTVE